MPLRTLLILLVAAVAVTGCGRRGPLEAPGTPKGAVPNTVAPAGAGVSPLDPGSTGTGKIAAPEGPAPRRHLFLDFLL